MQSSRSAFRNQSGFTLFELIIAMLLMAVVAVMIYSILNVGISFTEKGEAKIVALERKFGFLSLLQRQVNSALYSDKEKKMLISADDEVFRIVTRAPFIYRSAGVVLAVYRYDPGAQTIYYLEKRDYYNIDYGEDYLPGFDEMIVLSGHDSFAITYLAEVGPEVTVHYRGEDHVFIPKCLNDEMLDTIQ